MSQTLRGSITKRTTGSLRIEIRKRDFEAFCDAIGLYRKEFMDVLAASERDHRAGRVIKRKSLRELMR